MMEVHPPKLVLLNKKLKLMFFVGAGTDLPL